MCRFACTFPNWPATPESQIIKGKGLRRAVRANQAIWQAIGGRADRKKGGDNYNEQCLFHVWFSPIYSVSRAFLPSIAACFTRVAWWYAIFFF